MNRVRGSTVEPDLPVMGLRRFEWRAWRPGIRWEKRCPIGQRAQVIDQSYLTSWNNKEARGTRAADSNWGYGSVYRSMPLDQGVVRGTRGGRKMTLPELVGAMENAATVDLRGAQVLPWALRVLGTPRDPALRDAVAKLRTWARGGAHRIDRNRDGQYDEAEAVRIMDAWWPLWLHAEFQPTLGGALFSEIEGMNELVNAPNNSSQHLGSAWQAGWNGDAQKELRSVLGRHVRGRYSRVYFGHGSLKRCRKVLANSLRQALANHSSEHLYSVY